METPTVTVERIEIVARLSHVDLGVVFLALLIAAVVAAAVLLFMRRRAAQHSR